MIPQTRAVQKVSSEQSQGLCSAVSLPPPTRTKALYVTSPSGPRFIPLGLNSAQISRQVHISNHLLHEG